MNCGLKMQSSKKKSNALGKTTISLEEFKREFDRRHDFESEDLQVLANNFPEVDFYNIPEAWIIPIDKMLRVIGKYVSYISQDCGHVRVMRRVMDGDPSVRPGKETDRDKEIFSQISLLEKRVRAIDKDLHDKLDYE